MHTIIGNHAIRIAERDGLQLREVSRLTGKPDRLISIESAKWMLRDNAGSIALVAEPAGWVTEAGKRAAKGRREVEWFFRGWYYLGPDPEGVEPRWKQN